MHSSKRRSKSSRPSLPIYAAEMPFAVDPVGDTGAATTGELIAIPASPPAAVVPLPFPEPPEELFRLDMGFRPRKLPGSLLLLPIFPFLLDPVPPEPALDDFSFDLDDLSPLPLLSASKSISGLPSHFFKMIPSWSCFLDRADFTIVWECDFGSPCFLSQSCSANCVLAVWDIKVLRRSIICSGLMGWVGSTGRLGSNFCGCCDGCWG